MIFHLSFGGLGLEDLSFGGLGLEDLFGFFLLDFITFLYWPPSTLLWQAIPKSTKEKGVIASRYSKVKVDLSACGPLCEACLCFPTQCWHWYMRHEFYKTCYLFVMHVRRIRLIPQIIRVNFIEVCHFGHAQPLTSTNRLLKLTHLCTALFIYMALSKTCVGALHAPQKKSIKNPHLRHPLHFFQKRWQFSFM